MGAGLPSDGEVTAWAVAARNGDLVARERFVRATQRDVWRFLAELAGSPAADGLTRETYLRALGSLPRSSARSWLLSIARRVALGTLADEPRVAFVLTQTLGLSYEEAASVCRCPVATIRSQVARVREDLVAMPRAAESTSRDRLTG